MARITLNVSWRDWKELLAQTAVCWSKHNAPRMGAALAYYSLLSLMPMLLILISIAGLVFGANGAQARVLDQLQFLIGAQRTSVLEVLLHGAENKAQGVLATVVGVLILTFGATGVLVELRNALNTVWEVPVRQLSTLQELIGIMKDRLWSLALVVAIVVALTVLLLLAASISALGQWTPILPLSEGVLHLLNAALSFVVITSAFAAIYKIVPKVPLKWRDVILGAAVTAVLFTLGNFLLGLYLGKVSFSSTYGAASSAVILAIWVYYSSQIFFFGAEFTKVFAANYGSAPAGKRQKRP